MPVVQSASFPASVPTPRLRPGERPAWWNASADRPAFARWRAASASSALSLDGWVAVLLELDLVFKDLAVRSDASDVLAAAAAAERHQPRLAPTPELRRWINPGPPARDDDELPEVLLPARLTARLAPGRRLDDRLCPSRLALALACDRAAAAHGRTMESWAMSAALRRA